MTAKEILNKVKAAFIGEPIVEPVVTPIVASKIYKLKDGGEISIAQTGDVIAIGDMVTIGALPSEGELVLDDGQIIVIDATGAITEIRPAEPVTTDLTEATLPTVEERITAIESAISQLKTPAITTGMATEVQFQEATKKIEKQDEVIKGLFELVEKLIEEPTTEPKTLTGNKKEQFERITKREERHQRIAEELKKNKALA